MRTLTYTVAGKTWHLLLNAAAVFNAYDKFGSEGSLLDHLDGNDKETFEATCWFLNELATQGELLRRYQGHDPGKFPTEQMFRAVLGPFDVPAAKAAVRQAIAFGFFREEDRDKPIDLGLAELEKKTARS